MMQTIVALRQHIAGNYIAYGIILLFGLIQLFFITRPFEYLLTNVLPDDAFYYFQIARHIVEGHGSTFDGLHMTNGYHPLWMLVLLPLFSLFSIGGTFDVVPIYVALGVSVVLTIGTAVVLLQLISRFTKNTLLKAFSLFVFLFNPLILFESINGLETSLALFLTTLFFWCAVRTEEHTRTRDYMIVGIVAGLMVLARLDMAVYAIAFALWLLVRLGLKAGIKRALFAGGIALLVASPWFIWNYLTFGMLLTSASNANTIVHHALVVQDNGASLFQSVKAVFYMLVYHGNEVLSRSGMGWFVFGLLGAIGAGCTMAGIRILYVRKSTPVLYALFFGFLALFFINAGIRFTGRTWYFVSGIIFVALASAWMFEHIFQKMSGTIQKSMLVVLSGLLACSFFVSWYSEIRNQMSVQKSMYEMAQYMNEHLAPKTVVGVFNAGVQGYFSHMTVVNLDGLVNNSAYEAIQEKRLWTYIQEERISHISDFDLYLSYKYKSFLDTPDIFKELESVTRIVAPENARSIPDIALYLVNEKE